MGKLAVRILGAAGVAMLSIGMFGSGVASADALTGKTYSDAIDTISGWNATPVIESVTGSQVATDDCVVTSWHKSMFLDASGYGPDNEIMLTLNCNNTLAAPGHPGNSVVTPEGQRQKKDENTAEWLNNHQDWCQKSDDNAQDCVAFCNRTGLCEF